MLLLFIFDELLEAISNWFIVKVLKLGDDLGDFLEVSELFCNWVLFEINIGQPWHPSKVFQFLDRTDIITLKVQDLQFLHKANIEKFFDRIVCDV